MVLLPLLIPYAAGVEDVELVGEVEPLTVAWAQLATRVPPERWQIERFLSLLIPPVSGISGLFPARFCIRMLLIHEHQLFD